MPRSLALVLLLACTEVPRTNPLDPVAPEAIRASAHIEGIVSYEAAATASDGQVVAFSALDADGPRSFAATPDATGAFVVDVPSGTYNVFVKASRFTPAAFYGISVAPGQTYALGALTLLLARGSVSGQVLISDGLSRSGAPAASVPVSFARVDDSSGLVFSATTGTDGRFRSDGVPEGRYIVRASKDGYAPGYLSDPIDISNLAAAKAAPITLYPASAIVRPVGGGFTARRDIAVDLLAFVEGLHDMRVSEDATFSGVDYGTFAASITFTLSDVEGVHHLYAQFRDAAGQESPVFSVSVVLDRTPPTVTQLEIAGGKAAIVADSANVALGGYDALSGVRGYRLSSDGTLDDEPELAAESVGSAITLVVAQPFAGPDGDRTVTLVWIDRAGNVSPPTQATITKDTTPPQLTAFSVVGAPFVQSLVVTLNVQAAGATEMLLSNRGDFADASWQPFLAARTWVLPPNDGLKTVYLKVRDAAENTLAAVNAQVTLDATPPTAVFGINSFYNGQGVTTSGSVTLNLDASDAVSGLTQVQISNSQDFTGATLEAWQASRPSWPLSAGDGLKFVYVRFFDAAGNVTVASNFITKDTTGPQGSVTILQGASTNQTTVNLLVSSADADTMQISGDVDAAQLPPTFQPFSSSIAVPLAVTGCVDPGNCARTVDVIFRDVNLNASSAAQATIVYDGVAPTLLSGGPTGGVISTTQPLQFVFSEQLRRASVQTSGGIAAATPLPGLFTMSTVADDTLHFAPGVGGWPNGPQTLNINYADRAGNPGQSLAYAFIVDGAGPVATLSPASGTPIKRDVPIVIDFDETVAVGTLAATGSLLGSGYNPAFSNANKRLTLSPQGQWPNATGLTLQLSIADLVGNGSATNASYDVDTTRPTVTSFAPSGGVIGSGFPIVVNFSEPIDASTLVVGGSLTSSVSITRLWLSSQSVQLTPDAWVSGNRTLTVSAHDLAGNDMSPAASASYSVDVTPPVGTLTAPTGNVVDASAPIQIQFNEQMSTGTESIVAGAAPLGAASVAWSGGDTLTLNGPWQLGANRSFSVTARDLAGNVSSSVNVTLSILNGIVYVGGPSGSTGNPGTFDAPLAAIPAAITRAAGLYPSAEVRVAGGSYVVDSQAGTHVVLSNGINLTGGYAPDFSSRNPALFPSVVSDVPSGPGTLSTPSRALSCFQGDNATVDGFTFQAAPSGAYTAAVACLSTGAPVLQNNIILAGPSATAAAYGVLLRSGAALLRNSITGPVSVEATGVRVIGNTLTAPAAALTLTAGGAVVANNTITGSQIGVTIGATGPATLINNVIACTAGTGAIGVLETVDTSPAAVENNDISASCTTALYADFVASGPTCPPPYDTANACYADAPSLNASAVASAVGGNVDLTPLFADAAQRLSNIAALDIRFGGRVVAGSDATADRDGQARTLGGVGPSGAQNAGAQGWSMGAFENDAP